jgi:hypothetical protein
MQVRHNVLLHTGKQSNNLKSSLKSNSVLRLATATVAHWQAKQQFEKQFEKQ